MQYSDNICFVFRKCVEHLYLLNFPQPGSRPLADIKHLPICEATFNALAHFCNVEYAFFNEKEEDVQMGSLDHFENLFYSFKTQSSNLMIMGGMEPIDKHLLRQFTPFG